MKKLKIKNQETFVSNDSSTTAVEVEYAGDDYRTVIVNGKKFVLGINNIEDDKIIIKNFNLI